MKQKLSIVRALIHDPEVLFLDEPTLGLDPLTSNYVRGLIRSLTREGKTVILTTHYMHEAEELCDRIAIMDRGSVVAVGSPDELKAKYGKADLEGVFIHLTTSAVGSPYRSRIRIKARRRFII